MKRAFEEFISVPEETGVVMVIEKEFGPRTAEDWAKIARGLADIVKITFGTAALYNQEVLKEKLRIYKDAGMKTMTGGTLTEVAILTAGGYSRRELEGYLRYAKSLGFTHIEFSDGSIYIPDEKRSEIIRMCIDEGLEVISEVGKKDPKKDALITIEKRIELMRKDLESGAKMVIIEARESGKGIGVMDREGKVDFAELDAIINAVGLENTMIEAPEKSQQQAIFMRYGPKANIGNVQPRDILSVGALRGGLRGDTISALRREAWEKYHVSQDAPKEYMV
ncbi:phosphosulfolactate synthase [Candidatus Calescamantes bacterium]|nr:phosphosulfolactate synthase [Candidatus Calescamantes bacterium]